MKTRKFFIGLLGIIAVAATFCSCDDDDDYPNLRYPTALVTVRPSSDGSFVMQLDNSTTLYPTNITKAPYGDKEVRALVNFTDGGTASDGRREVYVNWIDSVRTKLPVADLGEENDSVYGNDPIEIVKDWVTVAEDGYLTLRIRTRWGASGKVHYLNLLSGSNADDPFEMELRHDADGDTIGQWGDALIAFNLNDLPRTDGDNVKLKLSWMSFTGKKSTEFDLQLHASTESVDTDGLTFSSSVE